VDIQVWLATSCFVTRGRSMFWLRVVTRPLRRLQGVGLQHRQKQQRGVLHHLHPNLVSQKDHFEQG